MPVEVIVGVEWMTKHQGRLSWIVWVLFCSLNPSSASEHFFQKALSYSCNDIFLGWKIPVVQGSFFQMKAESHQFFDEYHDSCWCWFHRFIAWFNGIFERFLSVYRVNFSPRGHLGTMKKTASASGYILHFNVLACGKSLGTHKRSFWINIPRIVHSRICKFHGGLNCQAKGLKNWVRI